MFYMEKQNIMHNYSKFSENKNLQNFIKRLSLVVPFITRRMGDVNNFFRFPFLPSPDCSDRNRKDKRFVPFVFFVVIINKPYHEEHEDTRSCRVGGAQRNPPLSEPGFSG